MIEMQLSLPQPCWRSAAPSSEEAIPIDKQKHLSKPDRCFCLLQIVDLHAIQVIFSVEPLPGTVNQQID